MTVKRQSSGIHDSVRNVFFRLSMRALIALCIAYLCGAGVHAQVSPQPPVPDALNKRPVVWLLLSIAEFCADTQKLAARVSATANSGDQHSASGANPAADHPALQSLLTPINKDKAAQLQKEGAEAHAYIVKTEPLLDDLPIATLAYQSIVDDFEKKRRKALKRSRYMDPQYDSPEAIQQADEALKTITEKLHQAKHDRDAAEQRQKDLPEGVERERLRLMNVLDGRNVGEWSFTDYALLADDHALIQWRLRAAPLVGRSMRKLLIEAAQAGNVRNALRLVSMGANVNSEPGEYSALAAACARGDAPLEAALTERGAIIEVPWGGYEKGPAASQVAAAMERRLASIHAFSRTIQDKPPWVEGKLKACDNRFNQVKKHLPTR